MGQTMRPGYSTQPRRPYCSAAWGLWGELKLGCVQRRGHRGRHKTRWAGAFITWPVKPGERR